MLTALRALNRHLDALSYAGGLRGGNGRQPFVLRLLAWFATLWLILETLVVEKRLLARSPNEILIAIDTLDAAIWKLG